MHCTSKGPKNEILDTPLSLPATAPEFTINLLLMLKVREFLNVGHSEYGEVTTESRDVISTDGASEPWPILGSTLKMENGNLTFKIIYREKQHNFHRRCPIILNENFVCGPVWGQTGERPQALP